MKFLSVGSAEFLLFIFCLLQKFMVWEKNPHIAFDSRMKIFDKYRYTSGNVKFLVLRSSEFSEFFFDLPGKFLLWGKIVILPLTLE